MSVRCMDKLRPLGLLLLLLELGDAAQLIRCDAGAFYNPQLQACQVCRRCPDSTIIVVPCSVITDTECGRLREFDNSLLPSQYEQPPDQADSDAKSSSFNNQQSSHKSEYPGHISWKNVSLLSVGFVMIGTALVSIIILVGKILRARNKQSHTQPEHGSYILVQRPDRKNTQSSFVELLPMRKSQEVSNPGYDVTTQDSVMSQLPLFHHTSCGSFDRDSGISQ